MTVQSNNINLNYLIDPTFTRVSRLFVLFFERIEENNVKKDHRDSFSHYYVPIVEIKDFNVSIDERSFFDLPIKNEEAYKKIIEMSRNNDYTTVNFLDFAYFKENYKLTATDLSKQTKLKDPQQISFIGKSMQQCFSSSKNQKKLLLTFLKNLQTSYKNENSKICRFTKQPW